MGLSLRIAGTPLYMGSAYVKYGYLPEEEKSIISARRDKELAGCNSKLTVEHTLSCM